MSLLDIEEVLRRGKERLAAASASEEELKKGRLRGGSSGALVGDQAIGTCPRKAWLRYQGIQLPMEEEEEGSSFDLELMLEGGVLNEDGWAKRIEAGLPEGQVLLREEDVPVSRTLERKGLSVELSGRPDAVICQLDATGKLKAPSGEAVTPLLVIEHKCASALWSAGNYLCNASPKIAHLIQAALYGRELGAPAQLWYTSRVYYQIGVNHRFFFPRPGKPGSQYVEYAEEKGATVPKKIRPGLVRYELSWTDKGQLTYTNPLTSETVFTPITSAGIDAYYQSVLAAETEDVLPPKLTSVDSVGKKKSQSECIYCPLNDICKFTKAGTKASEWKRTVENLLDAGK